MQQLGKNGGRKSFIAAVEQLPHQAAVRRAQGGNSQSGDHLLLIQFEQDEPGSRIELGTAHGQIKVKPGQAIEPGALIAEAARERVNLIQVCRSTIIQQVRYRDHRHQGIGS